MPQQYVENFTYIGVNLKITGDATELHWKNAVKTFNRRIGYIKCLTRARPISPKYARMLFNLAARPALEYAFQVFFPHDKKIHLDLERLILSAAASIIGLNYNTKTETKRTLMGIESLECRRDYLRINFLHKIQQLDYLTNDLIQEAKEKYPQILAEWNTLQPKYNIHITGENDDPKAEVKKQVQQHWVQKDMKEMQKSNQAKLSASILQNLEQYILLPFWNHPDCKNPRRILKAFSGCDWLTPMKFEQPISKCLDVEKWRHQDTFSLNVSVTN